MAEVNPANIHLPDDEPQQPLQRDIKLHPFWTSRPRAWFTYVESRFRLVSQVIDVVDALPAAGQYEFFKNELLNIHQLSDYEKFAMLEFCPLGMDRHLSFHYFFMQPLLRPCGPSWERYSLEILAPSPSEQTACGLCTLPRRPGAQPRCRRRPLTPLECPPPS
jgi:hypothetical protein